MVVQHKLYVGLNDKETKNQILSDEQAYAIIRLALIRLGLDATIYKANGIYTHSDGINVNENTYVLEVLEFGRPLADSIKKLANYLKIRLNQESIGYQVVELKECELLWTSKSE